MIDEDEAKAVWQILESALENARAGAYEVALAAIEGVVAKHPSNSNVLHIKGVILELKALDETGGDAHGLRASLDMKKARICYEKALLLEPKNVIPLADLGTHWMYLDDREKASNYFDQAIEAGEEAGDECEYDAYLEALERRIEILEAEGNKELAQKYREKIPLGVRWALR